MEGEMDVYAIILGISIFSVFSFVMITFLRVYTAMNQVKQYGMRKEVTDPIVYWISLLTALVILVLKGVQFYDSKSLTSSIDIWDILLNLLPSIGLMAITKILGGAVIMRTEKTIYMSNLIAQTEDIYKFKKKDKRWMMVTPTGEYKVDLTNTTVLKVADITGAKVEKE